MSTAPHATPRPNRPLRIAVVAPRLAAGGAVGGAETLLLNLAQLARGAGCEVTLLTTCARNHFTWANELPAGTIEHEGLRVMRFPVNEDRDIEAFLRVQEPISAGRAVSDADEELWIANNVNSRALEAYLREHADAFDWILAGPYLFGLTLAVAEIAPERVLLVPCLHDEPFARVRRIARVFQTVRGFIFNTEPERDLAVRLFGWGITAPGRPGPVVGFALPDFASDPAACARQQGLTAPYILYCGRREGLKGTPLLIDYWATFRRLTGRDVKLVLTGSGAVDVPAGMGPHLIDLGFVGEQDKHDAMAGAVAFCHPSVNESLGIVLLESWLAGRPSLVHDRGVVLRDQTRRARAGLWFRDYPEFQECLNLLLDDAPLAARLGASGRAFTLREYSPSAVQTRLMGALQTAGEDGA
ncbi:MAG: glycosyltransferase family 4 protein [Lentisphaerae bacterium]|nr:glycosyltransferase family 4 protein [Lentisphaerota bacterium]